MLFISFKFVDLFHFKLIDLFWKLAADLLPPVAAGVIALLYFGCVQFKLVDDGGKDGVRVQRGEAAKREGSLPSSTSNASSSTTPASSSSFGDLRAEEAALSPRSAAELTSSTFQQRREASSSSSSSVAQNSVVSPIFATHRTVTSAASTTMNRSASERAPTSRSFTSLSESKSNVRKEMVDTEARQTPPAIGLGSGRSVSASLLPTSASTPAVSSSSLAASKQGGGGSKIPTAVPLVPPPPRVPLRLLDCTAPSAQPIQINPREPVEFENDVFKGLKLFLVVVVDGVRV